MNKLERLQAGKSKASGASPTDDPCVGQFWRSRDPRDHGLIATVLWVAGGYVGVQRFRKSTVRLDRFHRDYELLGLRRRRPTITTPSRSWASDPC